MEKTVKKINVEKSVNFDSDDILIDILSIKQYLSRKGYFSNDKDFKEYDEGILYGIKIDNKGPRFTYITKSDEIIDSLYFIPEVKAVFAEEIKEKKLRPFKTIEEFEYTTHFKVGDVVTIKRFDDEQDYEEVFVCVFSGYRIITTEDPQIITLFFGSDRYRFDELKTDFNYNVDGKWLPFGIKE